jgi:type I restriction enzyme M protein
MIGAIIGDIIGSKYEFTSDKTKEFELFTADSCLTDDSMMTIAVGCACAKADLSDEEDFKSWVIYYMRKIGRQYPFAGYGHHFFRWIKSDSMGAYNSFGNGSAMRVSPVAWVAQSLEEAEKLAEWSAEVTHNHPEGIKGAQAVAAAIYLARTGKSKAEIKDYIEQQYYKLEFTLDEIRPAYKFDVTCQGSVPQAIQCFLEATDFENAIRNAVSLGGDGDTQAAMAGAIAEAFYGIPQPLKEEAFKRFTRKIQDYYDMFGEKLKNM